MDEVTTTEPQPISEGEPSSQPTAPTEQPAEAAAENTQPTQTGDVDPVDGNAEADDTAAWLKNKGIDPSDPDAIKKAAELARNTEREFHKSRQEASAKLKDVAVDTVATGNPADDTLYRLQIRDSVRDFKDSLRDEGLSRAEIEQIDTKMAEVLVAKPYLAGDLDTAYALVKVEQSKDVIAAAEARGREAAKAEIARTSTATTLHGNASSAVKTDKSFSDLSIQEMEAKLGFVRR